MEYNNLNACMYWLVIVLSYPLQGWMMMMEVSIFVLIIIEKVQLVLGLKQMYNFNIRTFID